MENFVEFIFYIDENFIKIKIKLYFERVKMDGFRIRIFFIESI